MLQHTRFVCKEFFRVIFKLYNIVCKLLKEKRKKKKGKKKGKRKRKKKKRKKMKLTQDRMQRLSVYFQVVLELYRVITCSLLVIFVPQKCDEHICTLSENLTWNSSFYNVTLVLNFCTLFGFCPMYLVEMWRENRLIKYLDVNPDMPNDNESVAAALIMAATAHIHCIHQQRRQTPSEVRLGRLIQTVLL